MEKVLSQEERIRRAEELYNRRRGLNDSNYRNSYRYNYKEDNVKITFRKRVVYQIIVCLIIYLVLYGIKNSEFIFNKEFNDEIKNILSYDINIENTYNTVKDFILSNNDIKNYLNIFEEKEKQEIEDKDNKEIKDDVKESDKEEAKEVNKEASWGVGGADDTNNEEKVEESDVDYIKKNFAIIWPLEGTITSRFGPRNPTEIVSANHKGLDIAGNVGDSIVAGMDGKVSLVSEEGDYGKHIEIVNNDVLTLYAHCSKLLVSEGQEIKKGDVIAEVGSTGRATGPHLHFEIRRNGVAIDPELIL